MRTKTWSLMILFLILLGLAVCLTLSVRSTADDPWQDVSVAVAIGCAVAAALALAAGAPQAATLTPWGPIWLRTVPGPDYRRPLSEQTLRAGDAAGSPSMTSSLTDCTGSTSDFYEAKATSSSVMDLNALISPRNERCQKWATRFRKPLCT